MTQGPEKEKSTEEDRKMSETTAITCVQWMRRGVAKKNPTKHEMTEDEWTRIKDELGEPDLLPMEEPKQDPRKS